MDPNKLQKELENAHNALRLLQERIAQSASMLAQGQAIQNADFHEQIAALNNISQQLGTNTAPVTNNNSTQMVQENSKPKEEKKTDTSNQGNQAREKVIQVPVRKRTDRSRDGDPLNLGGDPMAATTNTRTFALELPATPFHPPTGTANEPPSTIIAPRPTPGFPADTPMAVQVLANLCARGYDVSLVGGGLNGRKPIVNNNAQQQQSRRQAAVRAAQAAPSRPARPAPADPSGRRPCNCKRSQCLKLYCECFAASGYCLPGCACLNCLNTEADAGAVKSARRAILNKDPSAFDDKVTADEGHKKGCKCKRSKCLKKYCECYNAGVPCNPEVCRCEGCKNCSASAAVVETPVVKNTTTATAPAPAAVPTTTTTATAQQQQQASLTATAAAIYAAQLQQRAAMASLLSPPARMMAAGMPFVSPLSAEEQQRAAAMAALFSPVVFPSTAAMTVAAPPSAAVPMPAPQPAAAAAAAATEPAKPTAPPTKAPPVPVNDDLTPGNVLPRTSALTSHISDINATAEMVDVEFADTASSPAFNQGRRVVAGTMTGGGRPADGRKALVPKNAAIDGPTSLSQEQDPRGKRPRRAASGGVVGAIAAETSDWGLDHTSPPTKRTNSMPDDLFDGQKGTALAARKDKNMLLRKAIENDAAAAAVAAGNKENGGADEDDVISALVSMSSLG